MSYEDKNIKSVIEQFNFDGDLTGVKGYGNGHINDTYLLDFDFNGENIKYILQRINTNIFKKPDEVMENIDLVTSYLREQVIENGGDPLRETMNIIKTKDDHLGYVDTDDNYWRAYIFIENSMSIEIIENPEHFYKSGLAFGGFQASLANFPADKLHFTIPNFHHTVSRLEAFKEAIKNNKSNRAHLVKLRFSLYWIVRLLQVRFGIIMLQVSYH